MPPATVASRPASAVPAERPAPDGHGALRAATPRRAPARLHRRALWRNLAATPTRRLLLPPEPEVAAPAPSAPAASPATAVFKDIILMDRIDDEDEELDVSMRLDARRVVVIDEDGIAKRSIAYDAIDRATYNTRKPGRFSLRRGASHWLTLEVGTTPIVLRLNGRTYEQVLTTLQGHGVRVERNP